MTVREQLHSALAAAKASQKCSEMSWESLVKANCSSDNTPQFTSAVKEVERDYRSVHGKLPPVWSQHKTLLSRANKAGAGIAGLDPTGEIVVRSRADITADLRREAVVAVGPTPWHDFELEFDNMVKSCLANGHSEPLKLYLEGVISAL